MRKELSDVFIVRPKCTAEYAKRYGWKTQLIGKDLDGKQFVIDDEISRPGSYFDDGKLARRIENIRNNNDDEYILVKDKYEYRLVDPDTGRLYKSFNNIDSAKRYGETYLNGEYQVQQVRKLRDMVESKLFKDYNDEDSHYGSNTKDYTLDINLDSEEYKDFRKWLEDKNLLEDYSYDDKNGFLGFEGDVELVFDVDEEDGDEYVSGWDAINFEGENILELVRPSLKSIEKYLEENYLSSSSYEDWIKDLRDDYYRSVL